MRKLIPLLALLFLLVPLACKGSEKSGESASTAKQVTYSCKCGATKTAPETQAPS